MKMPQRLPRDKYKLNLDIPIWNQVTFAAKSLKVSATNLEVFKPIIKNLDEVSCSCLACSN